MAIKLGRVQCRPGNVGLDIYALEIDSGIEDMINTEVKNRYDALFDLEFLFRNVSDRWELFRSCVRQAAETAVPRAE